MKEIWKTINEFPNYEVSTLGRVKNKRTGKCRSSGGKKYTAITLTGDNGHQKTRTAHSLVTAAFLGPRREGYEIHHIDKNKKNNCLDNLVYLTTTEHNHLHEPDRNRLYGAENQNSKLTELQVRKLRRLYLAGVLDATAKAAAYDVHPSTIRDAARGRTYRNVFPYAIAT